MSEQFTTTETTPDETAPEQSPSEESTPAQGAPETLTSPAPRSDAADGPSPDAGSTGTSSGDRVAQLEREGDIAADYLEELLDIADLDGDLDMDVENDRASVSIVGGDLARLVGQRGEVLDALQELTRLAVLRETGERSRLMLDIGGHRAGRREVLQSQAADAVASVRASGEPVSLDPMNSFERKVVHDVVAEAGLVSDSEGAEPKRYVVVRPAEG